jgi:acetyl-CoA carboxylase carboxyl transferase subunit beta
MVDLVVHRHELRPTLARLCRLLTKAPAFDATAEPPPNTDEPAEPVPATDAAPPPAPPA